MNFQNSLSNGLFGLNKVRFRRRSTHVPNLTDELSTEKERRLNQFGTAVLVWCAKAFRSTESVELLSRQFRFKVKLIQLGSAHEKYGV